jgi:hypothetical protein
VKDITLNDALAEHNWHGWPPQVWDGKTWRRVKLPEELLRMSKPEQIAPSPGKKHSQNLNFVSSSKSIDLRLERNSSKYLYIQYICIFNRLLATVGPRKGHDCR